MLHVLLSDNLVLNLLSMAVKLIYVNVKNRNILIMPRMKLAFAKKVFLFNFFVMQKRQCIEMEIIYDTFNE